MSEAKYKVGDVVVSVCHPKPRAITRVLTCYAFADGTGMYCESELTPYVRPLEVGDRVRLWHGGQYESRTIKAIHNGSAWLWCDKGTHVTRPLYDLERIPEEAGK